MKNFVIFKISADPFNADLLSGLLWEFDILGITEIDDTLLVSAGEDSGLTAESIEAALDKVKDLELIRSFSVSQEYLESRNWNEEWEKKAKVIEVSEKFVIKPSFKDYTIPEGKIEIIIDPKMSFGTGEHQTTRLVLELIDKYVKSGDEVLDVGTGTGILGIAASKLGAKKVVGVDNDEWCRLNALENLKLNQITDMRIVLGTVNDITEQKFDLVLANINRNVLIDIKERLLELTKRGKILILSGILDSDLTEIKRQFTQIGFTALEIEQKDEWLAIVFKKN